MAVGLFDSGVGGLTVARAIAAELPGEQIIYFADFRRQPYGPKPLGEIRRYALQICEFLVANGADVVAMACNTSTAAALPEARRRFRVPVVGMIRPGAISAARASRNGRIGVIGTEGTVQSGAYKAELLSIDPGVEVYEQACPMYVSLVEAGEIDSSRVHRLTEEYLSPVREWGADTLILGCTHYPPLSPVISSVMGAGVELVDPSFEVAREVARLLGRKRPLPGSGIKNLFYVNGDRRRFESMGSPIFGSPIEGAREVYMS